MESRWWLSVMRGVLSFVALGIPSHAMAGGEDGVSTDTKQEDETPEWAKKLYGEPPEFKVFEVAGHRFRVPRDYSRQSSEEDPYFQMSVLWPTLDPYWTDKPQPRDREDFDTLQVTISTLSDDKYVRLLDVRRKNSNQVRQAGNELSGKLEKVYGLWHIKGKSRYVSFESSRIGSVEQYVLILCGSYDCAIGYMPMKNMEVHIRFAPAILPDWRKLLEKINGLLEQYQEG